MNAPGAVTAYLEKAQESFASAASDYAYGRFNSCMNRYYY